MAELLTAAQMRAIEEAAISSGAVTGLELMERAGAGVVETIFEEWPELGEGARRAVVLCGPGNNGGDGFVVARLLRERGWHVEVFLYGNAEKLPPDAKANYERWREMGEVGNAAQISADELLFAEPDLFIDALFGTGLTRELPSDVGQWVFFSNHRQADDTPTRTVAVDIASGICADSGRCIGRQSAILPMLTVAFHRAKTGHYLNFGADCTGAPSVVTKDIGLEGRPAVPPGEPVVLLDAGGIAGTGKRAGHKYAHGHALILSGGAGRTGAARLAARGALRIGAGLVTLGVPGSAQLEVAAQVTAIMLRRAGTPEEVAAALEDRRINALCLGPGMGVERARGIVPVALAARRATVLDADALTAFADDPGALFELLHETCVLTPHGGEFARLFPDIADRLDAPPTRGPAYSRVDATRDAARRAGCVVLFKGPDTVIAHPDGRCSVNAAVYERAAPWLATAGSGDVLAGFITGLLARGFDALSAAESGAWLHVEAARRFGPGLIAEDLPEELPGVLAAIGCGQAGA